MLGRVDLGHCVPDIPDEDSLSALVDLQRHFRGLYDDFLSFGGIVSIQDESARVKEAGLYRSVLRNSDYHRHHRYICRAVDAVISGT